MGDVTGPISTLLGARHELPEGAMCDLHPDRPAVARIQGETDSFGSELNDMCSECLAEYRESINSPEARSGQCEWCKKEATDLRDRRDIDEGMSGRVYRVCGTCATRDEEALQVELDEYDDYQDPPCPTCKGRGTVNPLTAPKGFFCVGSTDCPTCDGYGSI